MSNRQYKNLTLIGTSHIAKESVKEVERIILKKEPSIVAVELDKKRLIGLLGGKKRKVKLKDIRNIGVKGFLFNVFGAWVEDKLGKMVGTKPGADMKQAVKSAQKVKAKVALVDQDIEITLKRLSKEITWREKGRFVKEFFNGMILRRKGKIDFDLNKVPDEEVIKKLTEKLKENYPSLYKVLIVERNAFMAKALYKLMTLETENPIVAVIGAGHEEELVELIKNESKLHNKRG